MAMKRRRHASLLLVGLLLQLALGALDPSCLVPGMTTAGRAVGAAATMAMNVAMPVSAADASGEMPTNDGTPCDTPADAPRGTPPTGTPPVGVPASCHALAPCGVSFVAVATCETAVLATVAAHVAPTAVSEPASVTLAPEPPPPRA